MTHKPTKNEKTGILNMIPYNVLVLGIKLIRILSYFPRPIALTIIWVTGSPFTLARRIKRWIRR